MRSSKKHAPYSLYKKQTKSGLFWYARFWDVEEKEYNIVRSTGIQVEGKRERWREADDEAKAILAKLKQAANLVVENEPAIPQIATFPNYYLSESASIPSTQFKVADIPFTQYLLDFWNPNSDYANFKKDVKKRPLSGYYIQMNHDDVLRHITTFPDFQGVKLGEVNRKLIKKWLIWMAAKKVLHKKKDGTYKEGSLLSGRRINSILQGMRVAVRWAVENEELPTDPFKKLDEATEETKEKGILTPVEMKKLISLPAEDPYSRLAVLLAARCGMRRGEVRGLKWGDIKNGIITIQHNFVNTDGLKSPKIKGGIVVKNSNPVPLPSDVEAVLEIVNRREIDRKTYRV